MTVYIEYVFIDNLLIDYMLIDCTLYLVNEKSRFLRKSLSALFGAGVALVFPLLNINGVINVLFKITTGAVIVLLSAFFNGKKKVYVALIVFFALTFSTAGIVFGVCYTFNIDYNGEIFISLLFLPVYVTVKGLKSVITALSYKQRIKEYLFDCELINNGKTIKAKGLLDSGNGAYSGNKPVVFADKKTAMKLFSFPLPKTEKIKIKTVSGEEEITVFPIERLKVYSKGKEHIIDNVIIGVSKTETVDFQIILHPAILKETENESYKTDKEVS